MHIGYGLMRIALGAYPVSNKYGEDAVGHNGAVYSWFMTSNPKRPNKVFNSKVLVVQCCSGIVTSIRLSVTPLYI